MLFITYHFMAWDDNNLACKFEIYNIFTQKREVGKLSESEKIHQRLDGFDASKSEAMKALNYQFSTGATHKELLSIARIICFMTQLKLDRLAVRDQRVLIKWFDENWYLISSIIPTIHLLDNDKLPINLDRELNERFKSKNSQYKK